MTRPPRTQILGVAVSFALTAGVMTCAARCLEHTPVGPILDQTAIIAAGAAADMVVPGSGYIVVRALETWRKIEWETRKLIGSETAE